MKILTTVAILMSATPAFADAPHLNPDPLSCALPMNQDFWELKPDPEIMGQYLLTYHNHIAKCSDTLDGIGVVAEDGFRVQMYIVVDSTEGEERITVIPEDLQYMAWPVESELDDGETITIKIFAGLS